MARDPNRNKTQAAALYQTLIIERRHKLEAVAARMGIAASTLYGWAENEATLPAWAIGLIFDATQDVELFARLSGAADRHIRCEPPTASVQPASASIDVAALEVGAEAGDVMRTVAEAGRDGAYDPGDRAKIFREIEQLEATIAELRARVGGGA